MKATRTFDLLERYSTKFSDKTDVFAAKQNKQWVTFDVKDYVINSNYISYGLLALGLKKGDKVATISNNRPEWNFVDMGLAQAGIIHVPVFTTLSEDGYKEIVNHSEVKAVFVSDHKLYKMLKPLVKELIFTFNEVEGARNWNEVRDLGKEKAEEFKDVVQQLKDNTKPTDPVTLIYTSGTTGNPKGVLLSHQNLMTNAIATSKVFNLQSNQRYLSILPICHVGERLGCYQTQYSGCSIYYAESLATIAKDMKEVRPHGFGAVPRILEKVYDKIVAKGNKLTGIKKKLFYWSLKLGHNYKPEGANGLWYELQLKLANILIFSKWREAMGGNVVAVGVGGSALQGRLERVFWAAGIKLLNMYGSTETATVITLNRQSSPNLQLGTVGSVIEGVELKIDSDGEILSKGPNIMLGYYKNEEETKAVIDTDGWYHTGDMGRLVDGKFLQITDRKKEIFKLSNSIYVSPQRIENIFKESNYIDQIMVIGEGEKFASAIVSPDFEALKEWCAKNNITFKDKAELIKLPPVIELYNTLTKELNTKLSKDEKLKRIRIVSDEWTPGSGALSPTLKLKRRVLLDTHKDIINDIYKKENLTE